LADRSSLGNCFKRQQLRFEKSGLPRESTSKPDNYGALVGWRAGGSCRSTPPARTKELPRPSKSIHAVTQFICRIVLSSAAGASDLLPPAA
jgi:hypothetical protein